MEELLFPDLRRLGPLQEFEQSVIEAGIASDDFLGQSERALTGSGIEIQ